MPEGINYQAVIRKTYGTLVNNAMVAIRVQIKQNAANGTVVLKAQELEIEALKARISELEKK